MKKEDRICIKLGNGKTLVAELGADPNYKEIYVGVEDKDGVWQELAIVRNAYHYGTEGSVVQENKAEILLYADSNNEDYTHSFKVNLL